MISEKKATKSQQKIQIKKHGFAHVEVKQNTKLNKTLIAITCQ